MGDLPIALKNVERGKYSVEIFVHDILNGSAIVPCWTYVTNGFISLGGKEFVFTLRRQLNEDPTNPPLDLLDIFDAFFSMAKEKHVVDVGEMSYFKAESGIFGFTDEVGFAYIRPQELPGVNMPNSSNCLLAILLVPGEPEFAHKFGSYRVLARLARNAWYFPSPPWSDRLRTSTIAKADWEASLLTKATSVRLSRSYVRLPAPQVSASQIPGQSQQSESIHGTAVLRIHPEDVSTFGQVLEYLSQQSDQIVAIVLKPDEEANMHLTWMPNDPATNMNIMAGHDSGSVTGGFLALVVTSNGKENGRFVEDGFAFFLSASKWRKHYNRLVQSKKVEIPAAGPGGLGLSIEIISSNTKSRWQFW